MFVETDYVEESGRVLASMFRPETSVHLGVDFQKGYCLPGIGPEFLLAAKKDKYDRMAQLIRNVDLLAETFRRQSVPNIWLRHDVTFDETDFCPNISGWNIPYCLKILQQFAETAPDLCIQQNPQYDHVIGKPSLNGFSNARLLHDLDFLNARTLFLTGGKNDICLLVTAEDAAQRGFIPFIVADMTYGRWDISDPVVRDKYCLDRASSGVYVVTSQQLMKVMSP